MWLGTLRKADHFIYVWFCNSDRYCPKKYYRLRSPRSLEPVTRFPGVVNRPDWQNDVTLQKLARSQRTFVARRGNYPVVCRRDRVPSGKSEAVRLHSAQHIGDCAFCRYVLLLTLWLARQVSCQCHCLFTKMKIIQKIIKITAIIYYAPIVILLFIINLHRQH